MLRSVLGTPRSESDGNLLQLAEKSNGEESGGDEGPLAVAPGARRTADSSVVDDDGEEPPRALPTGAEAVITQVNTRQGAPTGPALGQMVTLPSTSEDTSDLRASWRNKVRCAGVASASLVEGTPWGLVVVGRGRVPLAGFASLLMC